MPPSGHAAMVGLRDVLRWWRSKEVCLHSLPIRKWGRNSEFRPDLHPSRALFFCSYWETQWGLCVWRGDNCWSDTVSDSGGCGCHILWAFHRQSETPGPHFQVRLCSELPGHIPQPCLLLVVMCKSLHKDLGIPAHFAKWGDCGYWWCHGSSEVCVLCSVCSYPTIACTFLNYSCVGICVLQRTRVWRQSTSLQD